VRVASRGRRAGRRPDRLDDRQRLVIEISDGVIADDLRELVGRLAGPTQSTSNRSTRSRGSFSVALCLTRTTPAALQPQLSPMVVTCRDSRGLGTGPRDWRSSADSPWPRLRRSVACVGGLSGEPRQGGAKRRPIGPTLTADPRTPECRRVVAREQRPQALKGDGGHDLRVSCSACQRASVSGAGASRPAVRIWRAAARRVCSSLLTPYMSSTNCS
jgi:hypothetical protein